MNIKQKIRYIMPAWLKRFIHLRHLNGWRELFDDMASDKITKLGKVSCDTHLIFVAGLPKSGTTWLEQLLSHTPGFVQLNKSCLRVYPHYIQLPHIHDVSQEMLTCAPKDKLSFLKLHLNPYSRNFNILDDLNIKTVILVRDLRDMLVSRYYHITSEQTHWDYQRLMDTPETSRLLESMKGVSPANSGMMIKYYESWVSGWMERAKVDPEHSIVIKYEEMSDDIFSVLRKIYGFYGYKITDDCIKDVITEQKQEHKNERNRDLKVNLKQRGRAASTFRRGMSGEWRELFDQQLKDFVKEHAGQTLIKSGYEKDFDW